jgi:hypothetical protein
LQDGDPLSNSTFFAVFMGRAQNLILQISKSWSLESPTSCPSDSKT